MGEEEQRIICHLCPHACRLGGGMTGICGARMAKNGKSAECHHGLLSAVHADPIEKKPLHHFLPGSRALSLGGFGCNLQCKGCQNASISRENAVHAEGAVMTPEEIVQAAKAYGCASIAYTYNEPIVWWEFADETASVGRASGLKNLMVTAGFVTPEYRERVFANMDAANVDLKGFSEQFYADWAHAKLSTVLETLEYLHDRDGFWLEVTTLLIPGKNDDPKMLRDAFAWIVSHLGCDVPLHLSAFFPAYHAMDIPPTPPETVRMAVRLAKEAGIHYVYPGNMADSADTVCPECGAVMIARQGYHTKCIGISGNQCASCRLRIPGVFQDID